MAGKSQGPPPGQWVFFTARLSPAGLGQVQQLPFWVLLEEGREEPALEEEKGLLRLPSSAFLDGFKPLALDSQGSLGLYLHQSFPEKDESAQEKEQKVFVDEAYLVSFKGATVEVRDLEALREEALRLSGSDYTGVLPFRASFLGNAGRGEAIFAARCGVKGAKKPAFRCALVVDLSSLGQKQDERAGTAIPPKG
jgi:hypothetical protein